MDILDQDIERDDNELHNTQVVQIKGFATSAKILSIFFFLLGIGGVLLATTIVLRYRRHLNRNWVNDTTLDWEPLLLFGIGGILGIITGWLLMRAGIKGARDIRELRNISTPTLAIWNSAIIFIGLTLGYIALYILYLIVKYEI